MPQDKNQPFLGAEGKMRQAHEAARLAEIEASKAHTALDSISEAQRSSEASQARLAEVGSVVTFLKLYCMPVVEPEFSALL